MKEGDQGTRRAGEAKEKEKRTQGQALKKKMWFYAIGIAPTRDMPLELHLQERCNWNCTYKTEDLKKKTLSSNRSPSHPMRLSIIQARYPIRVANRKDKGVAVPQIVHSLIHVAFQCIPGRGQLQLPFPLLINVGAVCALNSCGSCVGWEVG
jgi:hypothetical protein